MTPTGTPTIRRVRLADLSRTPSGAAMVDTVVDRHAGAARARPSHRRRHPPRRRRGAPRRQRPLRRRLPALRAAPRPPVAIDRRELLAARDALPRDLRRALEHMAANIERFHAIQVPPASSGWTWRRASASAVAGGAGPSRRVRARRSALLPIVGADECHPGQACRCRRVRGGHPADQDGTLSPALLGAAGLMEVDEFLVMGGAQAIAALAYGTESIGAVDKIVGPGNAWVTQAKLEVFGAVAIDMPAGPSEVMVVADDTADPATSPPTCSARPSTDPIRPRSWSRRRARWPTRIEARSRASCRHCLAARNSTRRCGAARSSSSAVDLDDAVAFVNEYAPEHLSVVVASTMSAARSMPSATPVRCSWAPFAGNRRAITPPAPTTCCRPAGWRGHSAR